MQYNETPTYPGHTPAKKRRRWVRPVAFSAAGVLTLFIGIGIGVSGSDAPADASPAPTKTVTAEPIVETETVTETVEVTPDACIAAIDHADSLIAASVGVMETILPVFDMVPRAAEAGMNYDVADLELIIAEAEVMTDGITDSTDTVVPLRASYDAAVAECRGE